uniref:Protein kinase domain-containing protein n=1 Tax=Denticeps clupeoides TaxID=299321 RepID=A0AAY4A334_9TELE
MEKPENKADAVLQQQSQTAELSAADQRLVNILKMYDMPVKDPLEDYVFLKCIGKGYYGKIFKARNRKIYLKKSMYKNLTLNINRIELNQ